MKQLGIIILAAGVGKRMKSKTPKVMHKLCGKTMLSYVIDSALALNPEKTVVVINPKMDKNQLAGVLHELSLQCIVQDPPRGTGDAVLQAEPIFRNFDGLILVLCGDVPLITPDTLDKLITFHYTPSGQETRPTRIQKSSCTILTTVPPNPGLYGRIVKKGDGVSKIVENSDATPEEKKINEINTGIYVFNCKELFNALHKIKLSNAQKEYYLTDTIEILCKEGKQVNDFSAPDWQEVSGINTRKSLAEVEKVLQAQIIERLQLNGVTIKGPVTIDFDVQIGKDTVVSPGVEILGNTEIGEGCEIRRGVRIGDSKISDGTKVEEGSTIENAILG